MESATVPLSTHDQVLQSPKPVQLKPPTCRFSSIAFALFRKLSWLDDARLNATWEQREGDDTRHEELFEAAELDKEMCRMHLNVSGNEPGKQ